MLLLDVDPAYEVVLSSRSAFIALNGSCYNKVHTLEWTSICSSPRHGGPDPCLGMHQRPGVCSDHDTVPCPPCLVSLVVKSCACEHRWCSSERGLSLGRRVPAQLGRHSRHFY